MIGRFFLGLFLVYLLNSILSILIHLLIPNYYLAEVVMSVTLAFLFALMEQRIDRAHFYKYPRFWYIFFITGIVFCLLDLLFFVL